MFWKKFFSPCFILPILWCRLYLNLENLTHFSVAADGVRWNHTHNPPWDLTMNNYALNNKEILLATTLHSLNWQSPNSNSLTNYCNGVTHRNEIKKHIPDWLKDDALIVGAINVISVCCSSHLTWGLFTQSESFQPLWSEGIGAMTALCPAWMPCPGARHRWHERNPEL